MTTITPYLWFDDDAEAAIELYTSLFPDARVLQRSDYGPGMPLPAGTLMTATVELAGQRVHLLNGGPGRPHTEALSFFVTCADQNEVDRYWHGLIAGGRAAEPVRLAGRSLRAQLADHPAGLPRLRQRSGSGTGRPRDAGDAADAEDGCRGADRRLRGLSL